MDKLTLTISNDLWETEVGEYVTTTTLGVPPGWWQSVFEVRRPEQIDCSPFDLNEYATVARIETLAFYHKTLVIDDKRIVLWERIK